jgi:hypothetical protein
MNTAVFLNKKNFYGGNEIYGDIESPRKKYPLVILKSHYFLLIIDD